LHPHPTVEEALKLVPFDDQVEMEKAMKMKLSFNPEHYRSQASGGHKVGKFVHLPGGAGHLPFLSHLMTEGPKRMCRGDEEKKSNTATKHPTCMMKPE